MSVNKVILLGNVAADPVIRSTQDGKKIASFSLATSEKWTDKKTNEKREKTEWNRIVIYSEGLANIAEKYIKKGTKLFVEGSLQTRKWTGNDGVEKYTTEIILQGFNNKLEIIENRKDGENGSSSSSYDEPHDEVSGIEDDIPF